MVNHGRESDGSWLISPAIWSGVALRGCIWGRSGIRAAGHGASRSGTGRAGDNVTGTQDMRDEYRACHLRSADPAHSVDQGQGRPPVAPCHAHGWIPPLDPAGPMDARSHPARNSHRRASTEKAEVATLAGRSASE